MAGLNKVMLIGNLGRDPERRSTGSGLTVTNLNLATTETVTKDGASEERTEWHRVVVFGKTAENVANYLTKGSKVYIKGRIQTREWQDKDGQRRLSTEIIANTVLFLDRKGGERESGYSREPAPGKTQEPSIGSGSGEGLGGQGG